MKFLNSEKITPKVVLTVLTLFIFLNLFDAGFTLYAVAEYKVPELNPFVAKLMENGTFLIFKVGLVTFLGGLLSLQIKSMNDKQRIHSFILIFIMVIYYFVINVLNLYYIWRYF